MKIQINRHKRGGFTLIELMVVIAILAALGAIGYGPILDHMQDGDRQQASANLGEIQKLLMAFKNDNSEYPCDRTADELSEACLNKGEDFGELKGDNSNAYFRQLFADRKTTSEKNFFAKIAGVREGDEKIANGAALKKGENAMGYVMLKPRADQEEEGRRGVSASNAPLAMCCIARSKKPQDGSNLLFDYEGFRGHVFVVSSDGSVKDIGKNIDEDPNDASLGKFTEGFTIFPETRKGRDTSGDYIVLSPDL